jgi:hypothetical protein
VVNIIYTSLETRLKKKNGACKDRYDRYIDVELIGIIYHQDNAERRSAVSDAPARRGQDKKEQQQQQHKRLG